MSGITPHDQFAPVNPVVVQANQRVHSQLASHYNETEPHFRPENQSKVRRRIEALAARSPSTARMLDLGCGTGFLRNLAPGLFPSIDGIDATRAMLDRADLSPGNITLHEGVVENLPFGYNTFDAVTAYRVPTSLDEYYLPADQRLYKTNQG